MSFFGKGLPCPILYSSRRPSHNPIQCPSLARGSLVQFCTLRGVRSITSSNGLLWQGAPLSKLRLSTPHILSGLLMMLFGRGLPCPNRSFSRLVLKLHFPSASTHFWQGAPLFKFPMLQGSRSEDFLLPRRTMKRRLSLFIVRSHPRVRSLSTAAPLHPSRARYANYRR
jgi:hypothetical protein